MNKRKIFWFTLIIIIVLSVVGVFYHQSQKVSASGFTPWSGILAPTRAIDWSQAGVVGGVPNRTTICQTLGTPGESPSYAQNVTAAQIETALRTCAGTNGVVYLNPGTYTITRTLSIQGRPRAM